MGSPAARRPPGRARLRTATGSLQKVTCLACAPGDWPILQADKTAVMESVRGSPTGHPDSRPRGHSDLRRRRLIRDLSGKRLTERGYPDGRTRRISVGFRQYYRDPVTFRSPATSAPTTPLSPLPSGLLAWPRLSRGSAGRQDGASDSDPRTLAEYVTQCPKTFVRWCVSVATKVPVPLRAEPKPTSPRTPFTAYRWLAHPVKPDSCVTVPAVKSPVTAVRCRAGG